MKSEKINLDDVTVMSYGLSWLGLKDYRLNHSPGYKIRSLSLKDMNIYQAGGLHYGNYGRSLTRGRKVGIS